MTDYHVYETDDSGAVSQIPASALTGADDFFDSWRRSVETPDELRAGGWQCDDAVHPAGTGKSAYRIVFKTLRVLPFPPVLISWPNLRLRISNGDVDRGGARTAAAIPTRSPRRRVIPEYGRLFEAPGWRGYVSCPDLNITLEGWQETLKAVSFTEVLYVLPADTSIGYDAQLSRGREGVAPLLAMLDLWAGPRLLAMPLAEEVGETFDDWHWNRRLDSGAFSAESQASLRQLAGEEVVGTFAPLLEAHQQLPEDERRRMRLASQWYWRADMEQDINARFIAWWIVVESLEMPNTTNIKPVRRRLAQLLNAEETVIRTPLGKLAGLRAKLVHGELWETPASEAHAIELVARTLLTSRLLAFVPTPLKSETRAALGLPAHASD